MRKKMKFPFLYKTAEKWPWSWPSCAAIGHLKTLSFRLPNEDNIFKILNSAYNLDNTTIEYSSNNNNSSLTIDEHVDDDECPIFMDLCDEPSGIEGIEKMRSERLIFKPEETSSIVVEGNSSQKETNKVVPFKESVAMEMESREPFVDFKRSMEEMVEAHNGFKDWEFLEELLIWYLRINGKNTHGYIVGAFVELLVNISIGSSSSSSSNSSSLSSSDDENNCLMSSTSPKRSHCSFTSPLSFTSSSSPTCSSTHAQEEARDEDEIMMEKSSIHNIIDSSFSS